MRPDEINVADFEYTHLAFSFGGISQWGYIEPYNGNPAYYPQYVAFNGLKDEHAGLKTLIAIGGWNFDQSRFTNVASTPAKREEFADSVVFFLDEHGFDGIDLDWEYPVTRGGDPADYANYPLLCQALRAAFDAAGHGTTSASPWLITVATSINYAVRITPGYDLASMHPHVDWFNMMSYDIYGAWDNVAGANTDMGFIRANMQSIFDLGVPREKLVLGLAAFGRSSLLASADCLTAGCGIGGAGLSGCHGEAGNLPWFEIEETYLADDSTTNGYDSLYLNPGTGSMEMVSGGNAYFTSFDNADTFNIKYQYAFKQCMRGVMW